MRSTHRKHAMLAGDRSGRAGRGEQGRGRGLRGEGSKMMKARIIGSILEEREKLCVGPVEGL